MAQVVGDLPVQSSLDHPPRQLLQQTALAWSINSASTPPAGSLAGLFFATAEVSTPIVV
jgi:hypothetical protein